MANKSQVTCWCMAWHGLETWGNCCGWTGASPTECRENDGKCWGKWWLKQSKWIPTMTEPSGRVGFFLWFSKQHIEPPIYHYSGRIWYITSAGLIGFRANCNSQTWKIHPILLWFPTYVPSSRSMDGKPTICRSFIEQKTILNFQSQFSIQILAPFLKNWPAIRTLRNSVDYPFISPWFCWMFLSPDFPSISNGFSNGLSIISMDFPSISMDFHGVSGPSKVAQVPLRDSVDPPSALKARSLWAMFHWGRVA